MAARQRVVRWSKRTDELVRYVPLHSRRRLRSELGGWIEAVPRFATFVSANQDNRRRWMSPACASSTRAAR
jgi:hypothetical protein